jgi:hypothetical protein
LWLSENEIVQMYEYTKNLSVRGRGWISQRKRNGVCTSKFLLLQESLVPKLNKMLLPNFNRNSILDRMEIEAYYLIQGKSNQILIKVYKGVFYFQFKKVS